MHRRLLFVYRTRQSMPSFMHFHSETLPAGQICQSKGARPYKYHQRRLWLQLQLPSSLLAFTSGIRTKPASLWNTAVMGPLNFLLAVVLSTSYHDQFASAWTVNNFLMTGPKAFLTYASSVQMGAQSGIHECKHQFAWERWNCPENTLQLSTHNGLRSATRETSFVHAISAAGVMYTLTKNCSMGDFDNCGCDDSRIGQTGGRGWIWGGCSDNVAFGEKISKQFVDALEGGQDSRAAVNLHNNEAGRLAIKATMRRACKCHGVSGSCTIQTCWMQLADFREVGNYLKMKHDHAKKLEMDKKPARAGNSADNRGAIAHTFRSIARTELIYLEDSPDYCLKNQSLGFQGTEGRECLKGDKNMSQWERKSCRRLCYECGLRVVEKRIEVVSSCNCKFHWCCTVKCDKCTQVVTKYYCARKVGGRKPHNKTKRRHRARNN